jgi:hypothetical protein
MVLTATFLFAAVLLLTSCLIFFFGRSYGTDNAGGWHFLNDAFYGDGRKLFVKYFVFLVGSIMVPLAVHSMWTIRPSRWFTIFSAFGIMLGFFMVIVFLTDLTLTRTISRHVTPKDLRATI